MFIDIYHNFVNQNKNVMVNNNYPNNKLFGGTRAQAKMVRCEVILNAVKSIGKRVVGKRKGECVTLLRPESKKSKQVP